MHLFVKDLDNNHVNVDNNDEDDVDITEHVTGYSIYLATLQRMVLCDLRSRLAATVHELEYGRRADRALMGDAKELLSEYCNAVRDYDFMTERLAKAQEEGEDDLFQVSTKSLLDLCLMRDASLVPAKGSENLSWDDLYKGAIRDRLRYKGCQNVLPCESRGERWKAVSMKLYLERLAMGLAGGAALIAPMVIMVLKKDLVTTLVTTTVATMLFAGGLALLGTKLKGEMVLASVAAYAAVLVVFVGTSD
jgi:VIT1/CCC1 family predicted Fe2+/Mn2+ transporter